MKHKVEVTPRSEFFSVREEAVLTCSAKFEEESQEWDACVAEYLKAHGF